MPPTIMRSTQWHDLVRLTRWEQLIEVTLPAPWLALSLCLYATHFWPLAVVCSFYFFLTGLRLSHNAQHGSLGVSRLGHDIILATLSILMGASMHAVQATHMNHHRHRLDEKDIEGRVALLPFPGILLSGPRFIVDIHRFALTQGTTHQKRWVAFELVAIPLAWTAFGWLALTQGLGRVAMAHELAMLAGECLTAFFAVWIVHRCSNHVPTKSRTERNRWINMLSYNMLLHADHHAYPAVPTIHWRALAKRREDADERIEDSVVQRSRLDLDARLALRKGVGPRLSPL
jgi:fatty acid desaturase